MWAFKEIWMYWICYICIKRKLFLCAVVLKTFYNLIAIAYMYICNRTKYVNIPLHTINSVEWLSRMSLSVLITISQDTNNPISFDGSLTVSQNRLLYSHQNTHFNHICINHIVNFKIIWVGALPFSKIWHTSSLCLYQLTFIFLLSYHSTCNFSSIWFNVLLTV